MDALIRKPAEAAPLLRKVVETAEGDHGRTEARFYLAMACHRSGAGDEARTLFRQASQWIAAHRPKDPGFRTLRAEAEAVLAGRGN